MYIAATFVTNERNQHSEMSCSFMACILPPRFTLLGSIPPHPVAKLKLQAQLFLPTVFENSVRYTLEEL